MDEDENTQIEVRDLPLQTREAPISSYDDATRTVNLTWSAGAQVARYDWYNERSYLEELSMDAAHVRMGRLQSGRAPLLNTHSRWDLSSVLGVVTRAANDGTATIKFSQRADVQPIVQDVRDGIIGNVSVGYTVFKYERIAPKRDGDPWIYRAVDWEPSEISLVPIGADAAAGVRSADGSVKFPERTRTTPCRFVGPQTRAAEPLPAAAGAHRGNSMTEEERQAAEAAENKRKAEAEAQTKREAEIAKKAADDARIAEAQRQNDIRNLARIARMDEAFATRLLDDPEMTPERAGLAILREQAQRSALHPHRSAAHIMGGLDEVDQRRARMGNAIVLRANPAARLALDDAGNREAREAAREFRGMTLTDMAREAIHLAGGNARGMSRREIAVTALNLDRDLQVRAGMGSTSDYPQILASTINRTLRQMYQVAERTFMPWTRPATAPDFRQVARTQLSDLAAFQQVKEGGEYKYLASGDSAEKYSLSKYGGIVALTWESIVNDDLSAFDRIPAMMAAEAAATESDIVYGILSANAAMSDSIALFNASHGNLPTAAAITVASLSSARQSMYVQTGPKGRVLNLRPSYLVVGPVKEQEANQYTSSQYVANQPSSINPSYNSSLKVIVDSRITGNAWYLMADPSMIDTIEYAHLEGEDGLFTETRIGFEVDGIQVKARHVFAAKAIDWRGMVYNSGA